MTIEKSCNSCASFGNNDACIVCEDRSSLGNPRPRWQPNPETAAMLLFDELADDSEVSVEIDGLLDTILAQRPELSEADRVRKAYARSVAVKLKRRVHDYYAKVFLEMKAKHDARVTELLDANNAEVERRRAAENELNKIAADTRPIMMFMLKPENRMALIEVVKGEAAIVPLGATVENGMEEIISRFVSASRLDKPVEAA